MKFGFLTFSILGFSLYSHAQSSIELSCRAQAKDVAVQTYQTCVTDARQQRVDEIRKEYQAKLNELKEHYNNELKGLSGKSNTPQIAPVNTKKAKTAKKPRKGEVPSKGIAKSLPAKQNDNGAALPIQNMNESPTIVINRSTEQVEQESQQMDPELQDGEIVNPEAAQQ